MDQKIGRKENIIPGIILLLLIMLSFAVGYLFASQTTVAPIIIEKCAKE